MDEQKNAPEAMLGALLSNPDLIHRVGSILGTLSQGGEKADTLDQKPAASGDALAASNTARPVGTDGLAAVLSDPAMMEKLPAVMAMLRPMLSSQSPPRQNEKVSPSASRDQLLLALKPFLSAERRDAIDQILRLAKLGAVFEQLKQGGQ